MLWFVFAFVCLLFMLSPKMRLGALEAIWLIWATAEGIYRVARATCAIQLETAKQTAWYRNSPIFKQSDKHVAGADERYYLSMAKLITELTIKHPNISLSDLASDVEKAIDKVVADHLPSKTESQPLDTSALPPLDVIQKANESLYDQCDECKKAHTHNGNFRHGSFTCGECGHTNNRA